MASIKKVLYIDIHLKNFSGHSFDYLSSISGEAYKNGLTVKCFCPENSIISESDEYRLEKILPDFTKPGNLIEKIKYLIRGIVQFKKNEIVFQSSDIIVITDLTPDLIILLIISHLLNRERDRSKYLFILHNKLHKKIIPFYKLIQILGLSYIIGAQSKEIQNSLPSFLKNNSTVLPIPLVQKRKFHPNKDKNILNGSYLGIGSTDKGLHHLLNFIYNKSHHPIFKKINFTIQLNPINSEIQQKIEALKGAITSMPNIKLIEGELKNADFMKLLETSDFLITPYSPSKYKFIQSGIVTQGMYIGTPIIMTKGMNGTSELIENHLERLLFEYRSEDSLLNALQYLIENFVSIKNKCEKLSEVQLEKHGPEKFVERLKSI